jgi:hypothetical protein
MQKLLVMPTAKNLRSDLWTYQVVRSAHDDADGVALYHRVDENAKRIWGVGVWTKSWSWDGKSAARRPWTLVSFYEHRHAKDRAQRLYHSYVEILDERDEVGVSYYTNEGIGLRWTTT